MNKCIHKNFAKLLAKHMCWSLFLNKAAGFRHAISLKKTPAYMFSC